MPRKGLSAASLLDDPDVRRWFDNLARGSQATADVHLRRLGALCASLHLTPGELARLDEKEVHNRFLDFVGTEEKRGMAGSYIVRTLKAGKSWLLHNGKKLERPIRVRGAKGTPSLADERVPTQEELHRVILAGTPRIRTACALVAFSGVRPEVLGNYRGDDGLILADFPELKIGTDGVEFGSTPTVIRVRPELSKNSNGYVTFLAAEGCEYVKQYLDERLRAGERLGPESDLIHPDRAGKRFIRTINIGDAVRTAIRGAGFQWRPYNLRHYFDTQLLTAESKGKVPPAFRVHWMGHVGSIDARYTTNKRRLPKEFLEEMRTAYKRCEPFLSTTPTKDSGDQVASARELFLRFAQVPEAEISKLDLTAMTNDEVYAVAERERAKSSGTPAKGGQRAVPSAEVRSMLDAGWEYVAPLGTDQAVLRGPGTPAPPPVGPVLPNLSRPV
jgi:integrase